MNLKHTKPVVSDSGSETNHSERRHHQRVPLDIPCFIRLQRLRMEADTSMQVVLRDISQSGAQVGLPPAAREFLDGGEKVRLLDFPAHFSMLEGTDGKVVWSGTGACGVLFDAPIALSSAELLAISLNL